MSAKPVALDAYETLAEAYASVLDTKPHNAYGLQCVNANRGNDPMLVVKNKTEARTSFFQHKRKFLSYGPVTPPNKIEAGRLVVASRSRP